MVYVLIVYFSSLCRQVLFGVDEMVGVFDFDVGNVNISVTGDEDVNAAIVISFIKIILMLIEFIMILYQWYVDLNQKIFQRKGYVIYRYVFTRLQEVQPF